MKAVAEIVAAIILLASGGYLAPKALESFKKEALMKVDNGIPPLQNFTHQSNTRKIIKKSLASLTTSTENKFQENSLY